MGANKIMYHDVCSECDYLYHCFGRDIGEKIQRGDTDDMYLHPSTCTEYYPERKQ